MDTQYNIGVNKNMAVYAFPTREEVMNVIPAGRKPYIHAAQALSELGDVSTERSENYSQRTRGVVEAIRGMVENAQELQPPLPEELLDVMSLMVDVFDAPQQDGRSAMNERVFERSPRALPAATLALRTAVDHGQRVTYHHPSVVALYDM